MNSNYHTEPGLSASGLKLLAKSPAHFKGEKPPATEAMKFGSQAHCAILEPEEFDNRYTVMPEGLDRRSKEGKAAYEAIIASGKEPIRADDMAEILAIQAAVQSHPEFAYLLTLNPLFEHEIFLDMAGVGPVKMKADMVILPCTQFPNGLIYDLKSVPSAAHDDFFRSMWNGNGFIQPAWYAMLFQQKYNTAGLPEFWWHAAEKKAPWLTAIYRCHEELLSYGDTQIDTLLDIYTDCMRADKWPGYSTDVIDLEAPDWAIAAMNTTDITMIPEEDLTDE